MFELTNIDDQLENIRDNIKWAVQSKETRVTSVKAPLDITKNGVYLNFHYCEMFVDPLGFLAIRPTKRTYQRVCTFCGGTVDI